MSGAALFVLTACRCASDGEEAQVETQPREPAASRVEAHAEAASQPERLRQAEAREEPERPAPDSTAARDEDTSPIDAPPDAAESAERSGADSSAQPDDGEDPSGAAPATTETPTPALRLGSELIASEGFHLIRLVMATTIEDREPQGVATSFEVDEIERIYAFMEFDNPDRGEREVSVAWSSADDPDAERSRVTVNVGAQPRWRTWAYTSLLNRPGRYLAVVRDHEERVLARATFELTE